MLTLIPANMYATRDSSANIAVRMIAVRRPPVPAGSRRDARSPYQASTVTAGTNTKLQE
jgi:hypothetical protein